MTSLERASMAMMTAEPLQFLLMLMTGWVSRRQFEVIDYLKEENRILREQLGGRRLRFTDDQRRRLATKGKVLAPGSQAPSPLDGGTKNEGRRPSAAGDDPSSVQVDCDGRKDNRSPQIEVLAQDR